MNAVELSILGPALLAGLLVLSTHVPLGYEVLRRGIIFIDLAVAQVAGLGVILADAMGWEPSGWLVQVAAISAALLAALILNWTGKRWPEIQEAVIGVCFVMAASAGVLVLAGNPHAGEHLRELLVGQILWVTADQVVPVAVLYVLILPIWMRFRDRLLGFGFYALFAFAVTASVQLVGVYLVFASLIVPALATRRMATRRARLLAGYTVGFFGFLFGLLASTWWDLPAGAVIVWCLIAIGIAFAWLVKPMLKASGVVGFTSVGSP